MHCCKLCLNIASILVVFGCAHVFSHGQHKEDASSPPPTPPLPETEAGVQHLDQTSFIEYIFNKYGEKGEMHFEGFEHLMETLGIGDIVITDHELVAHRMSNGSFASLHADNHTGDVGGTESDHHGAHSDLHADESHADGHQHSHDHSHDHDHYGHIDHDHERIHHGHHHAAGKGGETRRKRAIDGGKIGSMTLIDGHDEKWNASSGRHLDLPTTHRCLSAGEIFHLFGLDPFTGVVTMESFLDMCPALIYELDQKRCRKVAWAGPEYTGAHPETDDEMPYLSEIWMYATFSVIIISLCGLCGVAVVPLMGKVIYGPMLNFLIALAIGTLTGDAFLHLLPQALSQSKSHATGTSVEADSHGKQGHSHSHDKDQIWHMLTALGAMLFFFIVENTLPSIMAWRDKHHHSKHADHEGENPSQKPKKRCKLKSHHGISARDQYRYDNQMVTHYMGEQMCREEGQCEVVACENIPCNDQSCPTDSCVIVTEGACGGTSQDHCSHAPTSNNNDGLMPCFQQNHFEQKHLTVDSAVADVIQVEKRPASPRQHSEEGGSRRCSGKWSESHGADHHSNQLQTQSAANSCKRFSLCSNDGGPCTWSREMIPVAGGSGMKDRASTPCSFDKRTFDGSSRGKRDSDDEADETGEEPDEKDVLKHGPKTHHHHRHHHHHHHHIKADSASAVAWMVIAGDGLHNLTDGIAIGAAFATSIWGGVSTTVAVFCHELPHEVGDFAMLLATGMRVKEALLYNILSSILCFAGMAAGILMVTSSTDGGSSTLSPWVFAATAGIFLYLALVDMIPELTNTDRGPHNAGLRVALQVAGMVTGFAVMFLIAFHEETLHNFLKS